MKFRKQIITYLNLVLVSIGNPPKYEKRRPWFSTNPTFENPLKNPTSYSSEAGFWEVGFLKKPTFTKSEVVFLNGFPIVGFVENYGLIFCEVIFFVICEKEYFQIIIFFKNIGILTFAESTITKKRKYGRIDYIHYTKVFCNWKLIL